MKKQRAPVCPLSLACCKVSFFLLREKIEEEKRAKEGKKKLGDLILQTARQTLVTWAKEGQLLCIPDEVETSVSGEIKHELYVAPVYCWQIKPPASGDARTSGLDE